MWTLYMVTNTVKGMIKNSIDTVKYAFKFIVYEPIGYIKVKYVYTINSTSQTTQQKYYITRECFK